MALTCPECKTEYPTLSGLAAHWRIAHPATWKGTIGSSLPEGMTEEQLGVSEPRAQYGSKVKRIETPEEREKRRQAQRESYYRNKRKRIKATAGLYRPTKEARSAQSVKRGHIDFCPYCGGNIQIVEIAMGMAANVAKTITNETGRHP